MKISELILELQNIKNKKGDIPVVYFETCIGEYYKPSLNIENSKTIFDEECEQETMEELGISGNFVLLNGE